MAQTKEINPNLHRLSRTLTNEELASSEIVPLKDLEDLGSPINLNLHKLGMQLVPKQTLKEKILDSTPYSTTALESRRKRKRKVPSIRNKGLADYIFLQGNDSGKYKYPDIVVSSELIPL